MNFSAEDIINTQLDEQNFNSLALELFSYQSKENIVYRDYLHHRNYTRKPNHYTQIPCLPIELFKTHSVVCGSVANDTTVFHSSGTTGMETSKHLIRDTAIYERSFIEGFKLFFGNPTEYQILALLPSYLERSNSSLIYMVDRLMQLAGAGEYYLYDHAKLASKLQELENKGTKSILFGVSYALLDFAENYPMELQNCNIIETGGMKGNRKEITKQELHATLKTTFQTSSVSSEYGMTELLSQAYAINSDRFHCVPWMKICVRDIYDPFTILDKGKGALNVIDLANIHSCCFIETQDIGEMHKNNLFEVLGRLDSSQIRGCNLLIQ